MGKLLALVRRTVVARFHWTLQLALALGFIAFAAASRWALDQGANGVPFATFFPFIILSAAFLELPFSILVAVGSMVAVRFLFLEWDGPTVAKFFLTLSYLMTSSIIISVGFLLRKTIHDLDRSASDYQNYNQELQHRSKNLLHIINAMAARAKRAENPDAFYADFSSRVGALVRANEYLGLIPHKPSDLRTLLEMAIEPFNESSITIGGPSCSVASTVGMRLMMMIHELATNATKHGALVNGEGQVTLAWRCEGPIVRLVWRESGGSLVRPPQRTGLGTRLLKAHWPIQGVNLEFRPQGVECTISFEPAPAVT